jgi:sortase (surface protein transpeptidase)
MAGIGEFVAYQRDVITIGETSRVSKPNKRKGVSDIRKILMTCRT